MKVKDVIQRLHDFDPEDDLAIMVRIEIPEDSGGSVEDEHAVDGDILRLQGDRSAILQHIGIGVVIVGTKIWED